MMDPDGKNPEDVDAEIDCQPVQCYGCGRELWVIPDGILFDPATYDSNPLYMICVGCGSHIWLEPRMAFKMFQINPVEAKSESESIPEGDTVLVRLWRLLQAIKGSHD